MTRMKPWLSYAEASVAFNRSKRALRLWVQDGRRLGVNPTLMLRTQRAEDRSVLLCTEDLQRIAAFKDAYRDAPTFGR